LKYLHKPAERAVVGLLYFRRERTAGKLVRLKVIGNTFTAPALSGAGFIGAWAFSLVFFNLTFHY